MNSLWKLIKLEKPETNYLKSQNQVEAYLQNFMKKKNAGGSNAKIYIFFFYKSIVEKFIISYLILYMHNIKYKWRYSMNCGKWSLQRADHNIELKIPAARILSRL